MDLMTGISSVVSLLSITLFVAAVLKVFQMAATLTEIKDLLISLKTKAPVQAPIAAPIAPTGIPAAFAAGQSGEEMLRALSLELDQPLNPTSIELGQKS
jgi:hypothetical protein